VAANISASSSAASSSANITAPRRRHLLQAANATASRPLTPPVEKETTVTIETRVLVKAPKCEW
jgi:hypothetical protein